MSLYHPCLVLLVVVAKDGGQYLVDVLVGGLGHQEVDEDPCGQAKHAKHQETDHFASVSLQGQQEDRCDHEVRNPISGGGKGVGSADHMQGIDLCVDCPRGRRHSNSIEKQEDRDACDGEIGAKLCGVWTQRQQHADRDD